jgi:hypothetical protein
MSDRSVPFTANSLAPEARIRVAINAHRGHAGPDVLTAVQSVARALLQLSVARPAMTVTTALYHEDPALLPSTETAAITALGIAVVPCPGRSNGARLNRQIDEAMAAGDDLFLRVDADDTVTEDRFLSQVSAFETLPLDLIGAGLIYDQDGRRFGVRPRAAPRAPDFLLNRYLLHPTFGFRVETLRRTGLRYWDRRLEDKELLLRATLAGFRLGNVPAVWGTYHVRPEARGGADMARLTRDLNLAFLRGTGQRHWLPAAWAIYLARRLLPVGWLRRLRSRLTGDGAVAPAE